MSTKPLYIRDDDSPGKARILQEALRLFAANGLDTTSIRDIAAATGMSNPALYKHFKTKQELAVVLFDRLYRAHLKELTTATREARDFASGFRAFVLTFLRAYDQHAPAAIFVHDNLTALWPDVPGDLKTRTAVSLLRDLLARGRAEGVVGADQDMDLHLSMVLGTLGQVIRQMYLGALLGPAVNHAHGIEQMLRAGLR